MHQCLNSEGAPVILAGCLLNMKTLANGGPRLHYFVPPSAEVRLKINIIPAEAANAAKVKKQGGARGRKVGRVLSCAPRAIVMVANGL